MKNNIIFVDSRKINKKEKPGSIAPLFKYLLFQMSTIQEMISFLLGSDNNLPALRTCKFLHKINAVINIFNIKDTLTFT